MAAHNLVAEHFERHFDMIFYFMGAQNLIAEHYERYFDMIFHFKTPQNLVAEHYERYFDMIFYFMGSKTWLETTMKESLTGFFTLRWLKT